MVRELVAVCLETIQRLKEAGREGDKELENEKVIAVSTLETIKSLAQAPMHAQTLQSIVAVADELLVQALMSGIAELDIVAFQIVSSFVCFSPKGFVNPFMLKYLEFAVVGQRQLDGSSRYENVLLNHLASRAEN